MPTRLSINHNDMRNMNLALVMNTLYSYAPLSRTRLAELTGLNKATVTQIINGLLHNGFVIETGTHLQGNSIGHPSIDLQVNPDAGRVIGAEIGGDFISVVVTDSTPKILWRQYETTSNSQSLEDILQRTLELLQNAYQEVCTYNLPILGIGLALPGIVDIENDILLFAPSLGWRDVSLRGPIGQKFPVPFYTGNEAHMAALGESYFGSTRNSRSSVYISLGISVHGGIIVNDNVMPGIEGLAGAIGHMVIKPDGELCGCGSQGCWSTLVDQRALFKRVEKRVLEGKRTLLSEGEDGGVQNLTIQKIVEAARHGDGVALDALQETGTWLGIGIANLINLLNPQYVVIGGPLSAAYEFFLPAIQEEIQRHSMYWLCKSCKVSAARHKNDAGVIGAVATVFWNIFNQPTYRPQTVLNY